MGFGELRGYKDDFLDNGEEVMIRKHGALYRDYSVVMRP